MVALVAPVEPQEQLLFRRSSYDPLGSRASLRGLGLYPSERDLTDRQKQVVVVAVSNDSYLGGVYVPAAYPHSWKTRGAD